jgi:low affinity Fe/Cu permease
MTKSGDRQSTHTNHAGLGRRSDARRRGGVSGQLERISSRVTKETGSSRAFGIALGIIVLWGLLGPVFHYSDTWQLVINTGTTIITFLMVFLIQRSQNKDALAIHLKLNELVAAMKGASNRMIDVEAISEEELQVLAAYYKELAELARHDFDISVSHSVEEARNRHQRKLEARTNNPLR